MFTKRNLNYLVLSSMLAILLAACNLPVEQLASPANDFEPSSGDDQHLDLQSPDIDDPIFESVEFSDLILKGPQCMPEGVDLTATLLPDTSGIANVTLRYRLVGNFPDQTTDWSVLDMSDQGIVDENSVYIAELPSIGEQAMAVFDDGWGQLEFSLIAEDGAGNTSNWPDDEPVSSLGIAPCPLVEVEILDGSLEPQFAEYGQAIGCDPSIAVFGLTLENAESLDEAWVNTRWYVGDFEGGDYEAVTPGEKLSLLPAGPSDEFPGAVVFATNVDIQEGGLTHLNGQDGFLSWRMHAKAQDGTVGEWPPGDAPPVFITACKNDDIIPIPTNTPEGPIVVLPTATATQMGIAPQPTPTTGLVLVPANVIVESGEDIVVNHDQGFDFDTGQIVSKNSSSADFALVSGDDPYLDVFDPTNGAYVGWAGFLKLLPTKSSCDILKTSSTMTISWPDHKNSYYCFDTSEGNVAWLQLNTYVSQPFSERRLIFDFTTYK